MGLYVYTTLVGDSQALKPYVEQKIKSCAWMEKLNNGWKIEGCDDFESDTDIELWLIEIDSLLEADSFVAAENYWDPDEKFMYKKHDDGRWYYYTASVVYTLQEPVDLTEVLQWR